MRRRANAGTMRRMQPEAGRTHVVIEVEHGPEPIRGAITDPPTLRGRFYGWIELVARLDRVRESEPSRQEAD
jgi:hypothetical protein